MLVYLDEQSVRVRIRTLTVYGKSSLPISANIACQSQYDDYLLNK